jgi:hypothetical protein
MVRSHFEALLAPSVASELSLKMARYRINDHFPRRLWFEFHGVEVFRAGDYSKWPHLDWHPGSYELVALPIDSPYPEQLIYRCYYAAEACEALIRDYPNLSIDQALHHPEEFVRGLAMLDRRIGRRRIASAAASFKDRLVESFFFRIRTAADRTIQTTPTT